MPAVNLTISDEVYRRLRDEAARLGKSPQAVAAEWLADRAVRPMGTGGMRAFREPTRRSGIQIRSSGEDSALEAGGGPISTAYTPLKESNSEREKVRQALQAAGLLTGLGPDLRRLADPTVRLEDVNAALGRAGGRPLSEIVLEQRGSKG